MCGIVGILGNRAEPSGREQILKNMLSTLVHRGPDAWGSYVSPHVAVGQTRLSILDLSGSHQPMISDRFVLVYNGEVFNYIELRETLVAKGVRFQTTGDTEVVLRCFEEYGVEAALKLFNGQFAFLLWDKIRRKLYVGRDRFGIRPLYRLRYNGALYLASEMKAFDTIPGFQRKVDANMLLQHGLLWNTLGARTVYEQVQSVCPGTYEEYLLDDLSGTQYRYYEIGESFRNESRIGFEAAIDTFKTLLEDAVRLRLRSDVPVAAYLSGGIDSSVISLLVAGLTRHRFSTFSVAFQDGEFDESEFQQQMAAVLGSRHTEERVDCRDIRENFYKAVYHIERPVFRTAPVPLFMLSKRVRQAGIKVVITGEGADEILFGYDSFKELKLLKFWSKQPESQLRPQLIKRLYPHLQHFSDPKQFGLMKMYYESFLSNHGNMLNGLNIRCYNNRILANMINKDTRVGIDESYLENQLQKMLPGNFGSWSLLQKNQFLEMKTLLSGYLLSSQGDRMSMAHSVEGRYPFLDHRLVDFVFSLPDSYKLKFFSQKHLLRKAYERQLPDAILNRPKRPYMAPDLKSFFNGGDLDDRAAHFLSDERIDAYGIFDKRMVGRYLRKFRAGVPEQIGYRDNMLITFMLSAQMACHWAAHPQLTNLEETKQMVSVVEMPY